MKKAIKEAIANGGATLDKNGKAVAFASGYQVTTKDGLQTKAENINKIVAKVQQLLADCKHNEFVGLWVDNGICYIDKSEKIKNKAKALRIAKARKQKAIFDWANQTSIYC